VSPLLRKLSLDPGRSGGLGLVLLLLLVVLAPSGCLLWFMNQAVQNERLAARQKLSDAYRAHLVLALEKLDDYWRQTAAELDTKAEGMPAPALFAKLIKGGHADAVICFDADGAVSYPGASPDLKPETPEPAWDDARRLESSDPAAAATAFARLAEQATNADVGARALQAQARCLVQAGAKDAAIRVLVESLAAERFQHATDGLGRLLAPNAQLMALELLKDADPARARATLDRLCARLRDYDDPLLLPPQRRFLMREVQRLFPNSVFSTLAAEDLAARFLEAGPLPAREPVLHPASLPGIWHFGSVRGRVLELHSTEGLLARMRAGVASQVLPTDASLAFVPPGKESDTTLVSLPAGPNLPGWRLALSLNDRQLFEAAAKQRIASYIWIVALVVATVVILAALVLRVVRRQMALTQLRNDLVANVTHELKTPLASMRLLVETLLNTQPLHEPTAREYLQLIAQENLRLSRLIDNFLTFSRIERNKYAFGFKEVPATEIVQGATDVVRERFNAAACRFDIEVPDNLPPILADTDALVTALVNLLDNAFKYSGEEKQITLTAGAANGSVFFAVKDNGIGLSPRETKRIFKRFYQVDQRLSRTGSGCGLGLSIVKFIVSAHRGSVQVESRLGRGSIFTIRIPRVEPHSALEKQP
jgi:signal transduction histidine kinase